MLRNSAHVTEHKLRGSDVCWNSRRRNIRALVTLSSEALERSCAVQSHPNSSKRGAAEQVKCWDCLDSAKMNVSRGIVELPPNTGTNPETVQFTSPFQKTHSKPSETPRRRTHVDIDMQTGKRIRAKLGLCFSITSSSRTTAQQQQRGKGPAPKTTCDFAGVFTTLHTGCAHRRKVVN